MWVAILYKIKKHFLPAVLIFIFSACEKVIDIDLKSVEPKYVIEATLSDEAGSAKVLLSQTKDFTENNDFNGIAGATITIQEEGGALATLLPTAPGVYEHASFQGFAGKNYLLTVAVNGETFTANCILPQKVNLDTLYAEEVTIFSEPRNLVVVGYQDPAGMKNYYRFIQYVNGKKEKQIMLQDDDYSDGRPITSRLYFFQEDEDDDSGEILSGREVKIEMLCIAPNVSKYWESLATSATGSSQATPANPVSNIQGGALGYFSAHTIQAKTFIVP